MHNKKFVTGGTTFRRVSEKLYRVIEDKYVIEPIPFTIDESISVYNNSHNLRFIMNDMEKAFKLLNGVTVYYCTFDNDDFFNDLNGTCRTRWGVSENSSYNKTFYKTSVQYRMGTIPIGLGFIIFKTRRDYLKYKIKS